MANRKSYLKNQAARRDDGRRRSSEWRSVPGNAERNREMALAWYRESEANAESAKERARSWARENVARKQATDQKCRSDNPGHYRALSKAYKHRKARAMPEWANEFFIQQAYDIAAVRSRVTGFIWHVDHVVPLNGKTVSGLHVEFNLAVIPGVENLSKGNRDWPEKP